MSAERPLRILTWQVHGNYLWYLSQIPHTLLVMTQRDPYGDWVPGFAGRGDGFPWRDNVKDIARADCAEAQIDCVLYQSRLHWEMRGQLLTPAQLTLPALVLEHDPPGEHPVDQHHWAAGPGERADRLIHVTAFNTLMWDSGEVPTTVIDHGVTIPDGVVYRGERREGLVIVNNLASRGRRLGLDVYLELQRQVPLSLIGMDSLALPGGRGEVPNMDVPAYASGFRFVLHPIRWTSLGLSLIEAMQAGVPVVGLAATELSTVIDNGVNGFIDTDPARLVAVMQRLLDEPETARRWGEAARRTALARFGIGRFVDDWNRLLAGCVGRRREAA